MDLKAESIVIWWHDGTDETGKRIRAFSTNTEIPESFQKHRQKFEFQQQQPQALEVNLPPNGMPLLNIIVSTSPPNLTTFCR